MNTIRNKYVKKMAKKLDLSEEQVKQVIIYNHELNYLMPQKTLKTVRVNLSLEHRRFINKVAKTLKVDADAVVGCCLMSYLEEQEKEKKNEKL